MDFSQDMLSPKCANSLSPRLWPCGHPIPTRGCPLLERASASFPRVWVLFPGVYWITWFPVPFDGVKRKKIKSFPLNPFRGLLFQGHQPTYLSAKDSILRTLLIFSQPHSSMVKQRELWIGDDKHEQ